MFSAVLSAWRRYLVFTCLSQDRLRDDPCCVGDCAAGRRYYYVLRLSYNCVYVVYGASAG